MKIVVRSDGYLRLEVLLTPEDAREIVRDLREATGDLKPPAKPPTWKPLEAPPDGVPGVPSYVMEQFKRRGRKSGGGK